MDYGLAVAATLLKGGGEIVLPPWYDHEDGMESAEALAASLDRFARRR